MPSEREKMESWPEKNVFDFLSNSTPGGPAHTRALAEIERRRVERDRVSLAAQQKSADAAVASAASSTWSMRWAIVGVAISAISLAISAWAALHK
jgi:hypothetical protein